MVNVPSTIDIVQQVEGNLEIPEIRVWCHPGGDDCYEVFDTFEQALNFIKEHPEAEEVPLIAFRGRELNIFDSQCIQEGDK